MRIPKLDSLDDFKMQLATIVAKTSYLPHPDTVKLVGKAVFPTVRKRECRWQPIKVGENVLGMYDDNATPQWALFWAHGIFGTRPKGWTIGHVWPYKDDIHSFTHLANIVLIPECLANLTDKLGPVTEFLRWHSWSAYGWKPDRAALPQKPHDFGAIQWRYFAPTENPKELIRKKIQVLDNQCVRALRPIMQNMGML